MRDIYDEKEVLGFITVVIGREMTPDERARYDAHMLAHNDPKRGYMIIRDRTTLGYWLYDTSAGYTLTRFVGGVGLLDSGVGGCQGYLSDELLADMTEKGEIDPGSGHLTGTGHGIIRRLNAKKILARG